MDELKDILSEDEMETFGSLLRMPDEQFRLVMPIFEESIVSEFKKPQFSLAMYKEMKESGKTYEDYQKDRDDLKEALKEVNDVSDLKKDFIVYIYDQILNLLAELEDGDFPITVPIQMISKDAKMPTYAHKGDAGMDVYATCDMDIMPGETRLMPLGFKVALPAGYEFQVRPKSGLSLKTSLRVANAPGTIDSGYRDECGVILQNCTNSILDWGADESTCLYGSPIHVSKGQKIAQFVLQKVPTALFLEVEDISNYGDDRKGGFGSTGLF